MAKIASLLNINPTFVISGVGNPFEQSNRDKIIRMFLAEDPFGKPDYSLIEIIAKHNEKAQYVFFKPPSSSKEFKRFVRR